MARVESLTEDGILALFAAKEAEDATRWGTIEDVAENTSLVASQGITIATHTSQIATALANSASNASDIAANAADATAEIGYTRLTNCTSTTRPTTHLFNGRPIFETDTKRKYYWDTTINDWRLSFAPDRIRCSRNTDLTIPNSSQTSMSFSTGNATEDIKINMTHSLSTNPTIVNATVPGLYLCTANVKYAANTTGFRMLTMYKTGVAMNTHSIDIRVAPAAAGWETNMQLTELVVLSATDYMEMSCYQSSGGSLAAQGILDITWIRPVHP